MSATNSSPDPECSLPGALRMHYEYYISDYCGTDAHECTRMYEVSDSFYRGYDAGDYGLFFILQLIVAFVFLVHMVCLANGLAKLVKSLRLRRSAVESYCFGK